MTTIPFPKVTAARQSFDNAATVHATRIARSLGGIVSCVEIVAALSSNWSTTNRRHQRHMRFFERLARRAGESLCRKRRLPSPRQPSFNAIRGPP